MRQVQVTKVDGGVDVRQIETEVPLRSDPTNAFDDGERFRDDEEALGLRDVSDDDLQTVYQELDDDYEEESMSGLSGSGQTSGSSRLEALSSDESDVPPDHDPDFDPNVTYAALSQRKPRQAKAKANAALSKATPKGKKKSTTATAADAKNKKKKT